ncbi:unnamed protein product [Pleuronectes platessa]|uniref:Uncharacterized protein n=1 Tax=Pleuronectes platessa TaxID=8262 RepID=A0A9N7VTH2_PLEPL|nr:unnamed protein product [Pleuronectes platessa]
MEVSKSAREGISRSRAAPEETTASCVLQLLVLDRVHVTPAILCDALLVIDAAVSSHVPVEPQAASPGAVMVTLTDISTNVPPPPVTPVSLEPPPGPAESSAVRRGGASAVERRQEDGSALDCVSVVLRGAPLTFLF